jgi:hypothetical protein
MNVALTLYQLTLINTLVLVFTISLHNKRCIRIQEVLQIKNGHKAITHIIVKY